MHKKRFVSGSAALAVLALLLPVAPAFADDESPRSPAQAIAMQAKDALSLTAFHDPPNPLPAAPLGTLIRSEAALGVVLIPAGAPPPGGWPVIAWAHGTSGVARLCAPSLMKDVLYGDEGLMPMVAAGFAVVATDYAGLGTPTAHQYDDKIPQANDVAYSVPAAHAAVPSLGRRWVAIGHSRGAVAVWGVAELETKLHDPNYAGGIFVAGNMDFDAFQTTDAGRFDPDTEMYWPLSAFGIHASYPSFDVARMLAPPVLAHYHEVTTKGCWYYAYAVAKEAGVQPAVHAGWDQAPEVRRYNADSRSADKPIQGPLMVLAGDDDQSVSIANIEAGVRDACRLELPIEFRHRPGLDHDPLMEKTIGEQLAWTRDRLDGKPWSGNCPAPH